jgi:hypothetical protein
MMRQNARFNDVHGTGPHLEQARKSAAAAPKGYLRGQQRESQ